MFGKMCGSVKLGSFNFWGYTNGLNLVFSKHKCFQVSKHEMNQITDSIDSIEQDYLSTDYYDLYSLKQPQIDRWIVSSKKECIIGTVCQLNTDVNNNTFKVI